VEHEKVSSPVNGGSRYSARLRQMLHDPRVRFVIAGGCFAVIYVVLYWGTQQWEPAQERYLLSLALVNIPVALIAFPVYRRLVFRASGPWGGQFARHCTWYGVSLALNLAGTALMVEALGLAPVAALAIVTVLLPILTYLTLHFVVFKIQHRHEPPRQSQI
jgi:putative flippase GtrA